MDGMIEQVRLRAYELWQMNGMRGCDVAHWTAAEHEILARTVAIASTKAKKSVKPAGKSVSLKSTVRKTSRKKDAQIAASAL